MEKDVAGRHLPSAMTCYSSDFIGEIKPDSEIEEVVWFTHKDKDKSSPVDKIIFDYLAEKKLII